MTGQSKHAPTVNNHLSNMNTLIAVFLLGSLLMPIFGLPNKEALISEQANQDYKKHLESVKEEGYNPDGSYGIQFDNQDETHRDRGYGYEKAYAYSRETAFFDFYDDKGALNAKDIVEKYGKSKE